MFIPRLHTNISLWLILFQKKIWQLLRMFMIIWERNPITFLSWRHLVMETCEIPLKLPTKDKEWIQHDIYMALNHRKLWQNMHREKMSRSYQGHCNGNKLSNNCRLACACISSVYMLCWNRCKYSINKMLIRLYTYFFLFAFSLNKLSLFEFFLKPFCATWINSKCNYRL